MPSQAFAPGLAFVLALASEFRRATAAAERYEQLKCTARASDDPETSPARRIYVEFYSDRCGNERSRPSRDSSRKLDFLNQLRTRAFPGS
jgi:hypothetical protein